MKHRLSEERWTSRNFLIGKVIDNSMFGDAPFDTHLKNEKVEKAELTDSSEDEMPVKKREPAVRRRQRVRVIRRDSSDEEPAAPAPQIDFWDAIANVGWRNTDEGLNIDVCKRNLADVRAFIAPQYEEKLEPLVRVIESLEPKNARKNASHFLALGKNFYDNALSRGIDDILVTFIHMGNCADFDSIM